MVVKDRVFILRKTRYGDADLILHALNPRGARLSLFARSALKSKKRFGGGVLEPTHYVNILYDDKSARSAEVLHTLKEASLIEDFAGLRTDYARLDTALYFLQVVHDMSREGELHSSEVFNLLGNALRTAETSNSLDKLRVHFETKLLSHHGVLPVDEEEASLLRAPIIEHASIEMRDESWRSVQTRVHRVLKDFLNNVNHV